MSITDRELVGILSNWNKIEAEVRVGLHDDFGKSKNIQDILDIIHELQQFAGTISPLRTLFTDHLTKINPHQVALNLDDVQFFTFLYDEYTEKYGIIMTLAEFIEAFLNIKRFATRTDLDNLTNLNSIVNLDVLNYAIEKHDASPNAHAELFRFKLPGIPLPEPPAFVLDPAISNMLITVDRASTMNYFDINGRVKTAQVDELPIDFSYSVPAIPIFDDHHNAALNSRNLDDVIPYGGARVSSTNLLILTPLDDQVFLLFNEDATNGYHGFRDIVTEELSGITTYYILCYPLDRSAVSVNILNASNEIIGTAKFNLVNLETEIAGSIGKFVADVQQLPNQWHRICITFDATNQNISEFRVNTLYQEDHNTFGTEQYQGVSCYSMGFWQHQLTKTPLPVPPIFTTNIPVSVLGTKIRKSFTDIFNPVKGTVHIKYISPISEVTDYDSQLVRIGYNDENNPTFIDTSINIATNPLSRNILQIISFNDDSNVLAVMESLPYDDIILVKRVDFSYTGGYHSYGFTDTPPKMFSHYDLNTGGEDVNTYDEIIDAVGIPISDILLAASTGQAVIAQIDNITLTGDPVSNDIVIPNAKDILPQYRINDNVNILEIGYSSETNKYLNGYLLNFRYYTLFANKMNIEFLLDQYLPE